MNTEVLLDIARHQAWADATHWKMLHQLGVLVNQRLALGAVGDHVLDLGPGFDVRREPGPAGPHHAALPQFLAQHVLPLMIAKSAEPWRPAAPVVTELPRARPAPPP